MARRRQRKQTKSYTLDVPAIQYIDSLACQRDLNSDSEALRQIVAEHALFISSADHSSEIPLDSSLSQPIEAEATA
jgi:hypothetical protein